MLPAPIYDGDARINSVPLSINAPSSSNVKYGFLLFSLNVDTFVLENAYSEIIDTSVPSVTSLNSIQSSKAWDEITDAFILIDVNLEHFANTYGAIFIFLALNVTLVKYSLL